jgi:hypothetical protein
MSHLYQVSRGMISRDSSFASASAQPLRPDRATARIARRRIQSEPAGNQLVRAGDVVDRGVADRGAEVIRLSYNPQQAPPQLIDQTCPARRLRTRYRGHLCWPVSPYLAPCRSLWWAYRVTHGLCSAVHLLQAILCDIRSSHSFTGNLRILIVGARSAKPTE